MSFSFFNAWVFKIQNFFLTILYSLFSKKIISLKNIASATITSRIEQLSQLQQKQSNNKKPEAPISASTARRSISMESIPQTQDNSNITKYGTINGAKDNNFDAATNQLDQSNRFRSINRSFRTAVDKSFDVPAPSGGKLN